jgi:hypothetical protein
MPAIEKLTAEQLAAEEKHATGYRHPVRTAIIEMEVGEGIKVSREIFKWKGKTPNVICRQISKKSDKRFKVYNAVRGGGWIIERLK